jgi:hypothetical protein
MSKIDPQITGPAPRASASAEVPAFELRGPPTVAFTVAEFCFAHKISQAFYYELKRAGLGPREMVLGRRRIISGEAAAEWRRGRAAVSSETT